MESRKISCSSKLTVSCHRHLLLSFGRNLSLETILNLEGKGWRMGGKPDKSGMMMAMKMMITIILYLSNGISKIKAIVNCVFALNTEEARTLPDGYVYWDMGRRGSRRRSCLTPFTRVIKLNEMYFGFYKRILHSRGLLMADGWMNEWIGDPQIGFSCLSFPLYYVETRILKRKEIPSFEIQFFTTTVCPLPLEKITIAWWSQSHRHHDKSFGLDDSDWLTALLKYPQLVNIIGLNKFMSLSYHQIWTIGCDLRRHSSSLPRVALLCWIRKLSYAYH